MEVVKLSLPGALVIAPERHGDERGFLVETFQAERYAAWGITRPFVQDNLSRSSRGTLRGLHLQHPTSQGKLVMALRGHVVDVIVDVRRGSPTFGQSVTVELSEDNGRQVFVPRGCAHGFAVLSDTADFFYKCDDFYRPAHEIVVRWNDPALAIDWQVADPKLSRRDATAPLLAEIGNLPPYDG
jgi:dTDP-4-dehydrorhamnose 3,5-epimerase